MNWLYKNNTNSSIFLNNHLIKPGDTVSSPHPLPLSSGLTCTQEGSKPDPVLFHDDFIIPAGSEVQASIPQPQNSQNVALSILCMSDSGGILCRFNSQDNNPVPVDTRGFVHVLSWKMCSRIFMLNSTDNTAIISVTAVEVVN